MTAILKCPTGPLKRGASPKSRSTITHSSPIINHVHAATEAGFLVFPCRPQGKIPSCNGGLHSATVDRGRVNRHWEQNPADNYGIATGAGSGFFVIDIDGNSGRSSLKALEEAHGPLPTTVTVQTANGFHRYFRHPGQPVATSAGKLGLNIDVRGDGGYVIGAGSIHPSGRIYQYAEGCDPTSVEIAEAPVWLIKMVTKPKHVAPPQSAHRPNLAPLTEEQRERVSRYAKAAFDREVERLASAPKHQRNDTLERDGFRCVYIRRF